MLGFRPALIIATFFMVLAGLIGFVSASAFLVQEQSRGPHGVLHRHTPLFE